jgi:hypothetical protein
MVSRKFSWYKKMEAKIKKDLKAIEALKSQEDSSAPRSYESKKKVASPVIERK